MIRGNVLAPRGVINRAGVFLRVQHLSMSQWQDVRGSCHLITLDIADGIAVCPRKTYPMYKYSSAGEDKGEVA